MIGDRLKRSAPAIVAILAMAWVPLLHAGDTDASASQKIQELERTIAVLRSDNAALREQLANVVAKKMAPAVDAARAREVRALSATPATQPDSVMAYWISGTGKRHNKNCRYFGTGKGHACGPSEGVACKICGG
jgi:septal ring factor EnvC (AmiA/AmiB activator)